MSKSARLVANADNGRIARDLIESPIVQAWFAEVEATLVEAMVTSAVGDDEGRRSAAIEVKHLRSLKARLEQDAKLGRVAERQLENRNAQRD